jgi:hypothetical protein
MTNNDRCAKASAEIIMQQRNEIANLRGPIMDNVIVQGLLLEIRQLNDALEVAKNILNDLLSGDVGRQTLAKLEAGHGTDTDDGRAWLRAAAIGRTE